MGYRILADRRTAPGLGAYYFRGDRLGFRRVLAVQPDPGGVVRVTYHNGAREETVPLPEWDAWVEQHRAAPDPFVMMCAARERS